MDKPAPDAAKLLGYWEEWEKGGHPGKVLANLKTAHARVAAVADRGRLLSDSGHDPFARLPGEADRRSSLVLPRLDSVDRHRGRGSTHRVAAVARPLVDRLPGARSRSARSPTRHATRPCCVCSTRRTTARMFS